MECKEDKLTTYKPPYKFVKPVVCIYEPGSQLIENAVFTTTEPQNRQNLLIVEYSRYGVASMLDGGDFLLC